MKKLENKPMYFMGDNHGEYNYMFDLIKRYEIKDCYFIHVGDGGEGFLETTKQLRQFAYLNEFFQARNIHYMSIRGNHSDPFYFKDENKVILSNFELIEDYTVMEYDGKTIQFIGGAISIDRSARSEGMSYWSDEPVILDKEKCRKVDILVTHTAPSWCHPQKFNGLVYNWALRDAYLLEELTDERAIMDEIFKICQPSLHLYGHFHSAWSEQVNGCTHKLLDINEIWEYRSA
jgi:hypothetical protein